MQYLTGRLMPARFIATGDIHPRREAILHHGCSLRHGAGMSIFDLRIETERLILRPLLREDYEPYLAFCADEATMRTLGGVQPPSVAWRGFCSLAGAWQLFGFSMFSVIEKASGDWIGRMGPWQPQDWPGTEVGWGIRHASWGR